MSEHRLSKGNIRVLAILGGVALSGLLALIGFSAARAVTSSAVAEETAFAERSIASPDREIGGASWELAADYTPVLETPAPIITFRPDPDGLLSLPDYVHPLGEAAPLSGTVYSNRRLSAVTVSISCAHNAQKLYPYRRSVRPNGKAIYSFTDADTESGFSLAELVDFSQLLVGVHTLKVTASCEGAKSVELFRWRFIVAGPDWETITEENFPDSYPEALAFFGDTERFLYRYQWVSGRYILADPEWETAYITTMQAYPDGEPWLVHIDSVPYFQKAFDYLENSYLRVSGTNGDTGVIPASKLITEYNGCYVSRFTSSLKAISHHTFGTAVDVNASMEPNKNAPENTAVIDDDVRDHLVYNGLVQENGITYYDFTYDGAYEPDPNGVPQTCVNYLLYELGFYRAGFGWAHYYKATSDAMHFCLSEYVTYTHDGEMGLRKVFAYADAPGQKPSFVPHSAAPSPTATPAP